MKNIHEVLADKANAVVGLRIKVDALRLIASLLADHTADSNQASHAPQRDGAGTPTPTPTPEKNKWPFKVRNAAPGCLDS